MKSNHFFCFWFVVVLIVPGLVVSVQTPVVAQKARASKRPATATKSTTDSEAADSDESKQAQAIEKFNAGQELHGAGKLAEALKLYDEAVQLDDHIYAIHFQRGAALLALNRLDEAAAALARSVALQPDFARGHALLGEAEARRSHTTEAEKAFLRAVELDPKLIHARIGAAQTLLARKAFKEALALLEVSAKQTPPPALAEFYAVYGEIQRLSGNLAGALESFNQGLMRDAHDPVIRRGRAFVYAAQKNYPKAFEDLRAAYQAAPDSDTAADVVSASQPAGHIPEGLEFAVEALKKDEHHLRLRAAYAALLLEANNLKEAVEQYTTLTAQEPKNADFWLKLGNAAQTVDPAKATEAYQKALEINPRLTDAQAGVALGLLRSQKFDEAAARFQDILASDPENYPAHAGLATALFKLDRFQPAAQQFIWIIGRRPEVGVSYFFLGICFDRMGDYVQALKAYEIFLQRADPRQNQLEIDKINLRLPSLKRQIEQKGQHKK